MSDSGRFEAFVRTHQDMVYATALRLLANPVEAEDVAQAVFLKAFERFDQLSASDTAAGWLKTVTRHACLNHLSRYRKRWRFFSELAGRNDDDVLEAIPADVSTGDALERAEEHEQLALALRAGLSACSPVLFHFEELSYQEIATTLRVSVAKVKTDIHRARLSLKRCRCSSATRSFEGSQVFSPASPQGLGSCGC